MIRLNGRNCRAGVGQWDRRNRFCLSTYNKQCCIMGSPDKPGGLSIQLCKSEKKEFYIRYSS